MPLGGPFLLAWTWQVCCTNVDLDNSGVYGVVPRGANVALDNSGVYGGVQRLLPSSYTCSAFGLLLLYPSMPADSGGGSRWMEAGVGAS